MKPTPPGWPRISSSLYYQDASAAIDWLCAAFGFVIRLKIVNDSGQVEHSELEYGEGLIMVATDGETSKRPGSRLRRSPAGIGGANTQNMFMYVDDVDAHCETARAAGAVIVSEPTTTDYGADYWSDRGYEARDLEGHGWWFGQRMRNPPGEPAI